MLSGERRNSPHSHEVAAGGASVASDDGAIVGGGFQELVLQVLIAGREVRLGATPRLVMRQDGRATSGALSHALFSSQS
jgi:hypothetical protein